MVINYTILDEILNYLDDSMNTIFLQNDFTEWDGLKNFLEGQYDIRLDSLLRGKKSSIHHLESGMKKQSHYAKTTSFGQAKRRISKKVVERKIELYCA